MEPPQAIQGEEHRSRSSSRLSALYPRDVRRCRIILAILSVVIIIGMIIGIIFVAHSYFRSWGGQGFLRVREKALDITGRDRPPSHLPLRPMMRVDTENYGWKDAGIQDSRSILPFYICGDQQNSCEAYSRPNICCPVGMACHSTIYSTSGSYCCTSTGHESECQVSAMKPPQCPNTTYECDADVGGGCCPQSSICSQNGCIEFLGDSTPPPITSTIITTITYTASKVVDPSTDAQTENARMYIMTTTTTMLIGGATTSTATEPKQGAEAQKGLGVSVQKPNWLQPHIPFPLFYCLWLLL